jgi:hypothetical protein
MRSLLPALLVLCAAGLVACGGGDDSAADVAADVERGFVSTSKDACDPLTHGTKRFSDQLSFGIAEIVASGRRSCRADVELYAADAADVTRVRVDGERATAHVVPTGGVNAIGELTLALVKDGTWKTDRITAVDLDRARFDAVQRDFAGRGPGGKQRAACAIRRFARMSDAALERALVRADPILFSEPLLMCVARPALLERGLPVALTGCIIRELRADGIRFLRSFLRDDADAGFDLMFELAAGCARAD